MSPGECVLAADKKYELLPDQGVVVAGATLYRIRALRDFGKVTTGTLGGFIASERNLSHLGACWVADEACVCDDAVISDDAQIRGCAVSAIKCASATRRRSLATHSCSTAYGCSSTPSSSTTRCFAIACRSAITGWSSEMRR